MDEHRIPRWYYYLIILLILWIAFCLVIPVYGSGWAEELDVMDYSENLTGFCHSIARINLVPESAKSRRAAEPQRYVVMCKTNGCSLSYEQTEPLTAIEGPQHRYVFVYATWNGAREAVNWFLEQPGVQYAEHDSEVTACSIEETDIAFRSNGAALIHLGGYLRLVQSYGSGSQTVAIIDSGVSTHSLLRDRMKSYGYDYVDADDDPTNDLSGHGTHVAGIVVDCTAQTPVWLYPVRVLNRVGSGKMSNVVAAVLEATDAGVDVINLSLESFEMSEALDDAIETAVERGITVVIAAGNSACDTSEVCPAHLKGEGMLVVGSVETSENGYHRADYSNYGDSVDLYVFGSNIESCSRSGGYVVQSGTSMAAAHVSGVCALMGLTHPGLSPREIERRLKSICGGPELPVPDTAGFVPVSEGFYLVSILMDVGDELSLPIRAAPVTSHAAIHWQSSDETLVAIDENGRLTAMGEGSATLTAHCMGFEDVSISVSVQDEGCVTITLPPDLRSIEDEALMGTDARHIVLPEGIETIGDRAFADCPDLRTLSLPDSDVEIGQDILAGSEQAIILCGCGSAVLAYADEYGLQYIKARE